MRSNSLLHASAMKQKQQRSLKVARNAQGGSHEHRHSQGGHDFEHDFGMSIKSQSLTKSKDAGHEVAKSSGSHGRKPPDHNLTREDSHGLTVRTFFISKVILH